MAIFLVCFSMITDTKIYPNTQRKIWEKMLPKSSSSQLPMKSFLKPRCTICNG